MAENNGITGAWAILGGSFDPIHNGHLYLAKTVLSLAPIHKVVLVPSYRHNFKGESIGLDYDSRLELAQRAVDSYCPLNFIVQPAEDYRSPIEVWDIERGESGYTSDLIRKLRTMYPKQNFAFIIGADNLEKLPEWHEFEWLALALHFIILPRPEASMPCDVLEAIEYTILDIPLCEISSTMVRQKVALGESIKDLVPACIHDRIYELYKK